MRRCRQTRGAICQGTVSSWVTSGPIQWAIAPPAVVVPGRRFPLALRVGAAATRVEGRVLACPGVPPCDTDLGTSLDPFLYDPASFVGIPARIEIEARLDQAFTPGVLDWSFYAELYLYDQDDVRHGPFVSPLAPTKIDLSNELRIRAAEQNTGRGSATLAAIAGTQTTTQIAFAIGNAAVGGAAGHVVTATSDVAWLHTAPDGPYFFQVTADTTGLAPKPTPYTAHVTFAAPDIPEPSTVDVALYVLPVLDVQWITPPPAIIAPETTFPLALRIDGPGVDAVRLDFSSFVESLEGPPGTFELTGRRGSGCSGPTPVDSTITGTYRVKLHGAPSLLPSGLHPPLGIPAVPVVLGPMITPRVTVSPSSLVAATTVGRVVEDGAFQVVQNCGSPQTWTASTNVPWISTPSSGVAEIPTCCHPQLELVMFDAARLRPAEMPYEGTITVQAPGIVGGSTTIAVSVKVHAAPPYTIVPDAVVLAAVAGQGPFSTVVGGEGQSRIAWRATVDVPWILLPAVRGADITQELTIGLDTAHLGPGHHRGTLTFHTPDAEPHETVVPVSVDVFPSAF